MSAHAVDLPFFTVQIKPVFPEFRFAEAERFRHFVFAAALADLHGERVKIRRLGTPELRIREVECLHFVRAAAHGHARRHPTGVGVGVDRDARPSVDRRIDAHARRLDQPYVSIESAADGEIRFVRRQIGIVRVIDVDLQPVAGGFQQIRHLETERRVRACMAPGHLSVHAHFRLYGRAFAFDESTPALHGVRKRPRITDLLAFVRGRTHRAVSPVFLRDIQTVRSVPDVPAMRHRHRQAVAGPPRPVQ